MTKLRAVPLLTLLIPVLFGLLGCKAGAAGKFIEPDKPTADDAMGELVCSENQQRAEPLVVDWSSDDRTDLEVAMRDGIVVATYDCNSFRVLENCRVAGGYSFAGVGRKEDVIQINGQDELHANFPLGAAKITAGLDRNSTIDIALVTVGKHRTSAFQVAKTDMQGDCTGATHFISSAVVGAFAVGTGTRGHVGAVAEVFKLGDVGGSSTSEQKSLNRDGDLAACGAANPSDPNPPPQCQSILRVELVAVTETPVEPPQGGGQEAKALEQVCAEGFVHDGQKCALAAQAKSYRCKVDDAAECTTQCEAGSAESCHNLAILVDRGKAGGPADRDKATGLYQKACEGGNVASCMSVAWRLDWKVEPERVIGLLQKSCDGDDAMACRVLGDEFIRGGRLGKDTGRGEQLLARGCKLAENFACGRLAWFLWTGRKQPKQALEVVENSCTLGNGESCSIVGGWLSKCEDGRPPGFVPGDVKTCETFPTPDAGKATIAFERACRGGYVGACHVAADRNHRGKGATTDMKVVLELLELGCPKGWYSCEKLGQLYEDGDGVKQDLGKALETYEKGCDYNDKGDCFAAARVAEKLGKDDVRRARLEMGCKKQSRQSCDAWTKLLESEKRTDEAKAVYGDVCDRMKYKPYCDAFERLGGTLPKGFKTFNRDREPDDF